ncbi:MAG: Mur ligase family protein [Patescibacteria group bacterium]
MKSKKYYFLGIGGIAMGTLAGMLKDKGHVVAGSDKSEIYPPMSDMLKQRKIKVFSPYNKFHLKQFKPDIVVVGNTIKRGNPELEYIISNGLVYRSLPDVLKEEIIENGPSTSLGVNKLPIVITGTHGKTTTTALIGWILEYAGLDPIIFCGGFIRNINSSFKLGNGKYVVIEGDEYTTAFWDKNPKFLHYRPYIGIVNNIDHDHLDVYKNISETKLAFTRFANLIPNSGLLIINAENKHAIDVSDETSANKKYYGSKHGDLNVKNISFGQDGTSFDVFHMKHSLGRFHMKLIGKFNVYNALAAISTAIYIKIPISKIKEAIASFEGVSRRAEILGEKNGKTVINDFAHHPTASRETLKGLRRTFHGKRLIALFELASSSSRMSIMVKPIINALKTADLAFIYNPENYKSFTKVKLGLNIRVSQTIEQLLFHLKHQSRPGDVIVIMSSKGFGGLKDKIWEVL